MDARLLFDPAREQLLLASCVEQEELASREHVWVWDGDGWDLLSDDGPPAHVVTGVAFDEEREVLVRYGGIPLPSQECAAETWEWDGDAWRQVEAAPPGPCDHAKLAYDAGAGVTLLVGGGDAGRTLLAGTWAWDGTTWRRLTAEGPVPRAHHGLVYDVSHEQVLLYGGYDGTGVFDDLWSWDGTTWRPVALGAGPGPRSHHGLAVSPEGLLLFGGATGSSTFSSLVAETWFLTDGSWRLLDGRGPSARGLPALGYDPTREVFVLYGGFGPDGAALADTWEWDGAWRCVAGC
jgi:hypothetical protein